jgi:flagellar FliL protein
VITIVRSAEMTDFADPSLGLIRRRILEKSNRALGKPLLVEVIFSDFSLVEQ